MQIVESWTEEFLDDLLDSFHGKGWVDDKVERCIGRCHNLDARCLHTVAVQGCLVDSDFLDGEEVSADLRMLHLTTVSMIDSFGVVQWMVERQESAMSNQEILLPFNQRGGRPSINPLFPSKLCKLFMPKEQKTLKEPEMYEATWWIEARCCVPIPL
jgi:hypothetical protein